MECVGGSSIVKVNHFGLTVSPPPPQKKKQKTRSLQLAVGESDDVATLSVETVRLNSI